MATVENPALAAFLAGLTAPITVAQVIVRRVAEGFELRHVGDADAEAAALREIPVPELRTLAQFTAEGAFRPLKSAPNLVRGWRAVARSETELEAALGQLYPGALGDWFAARSPSPPVTDYRAFTGRQSGMYRVTQQLDDVQAADVIRACCHRRFCLKRRLWSVAGLATDAAADKSVIPCLEPCALLLELARRAARLEQEERLASSLGAGEIASVIAAVERALEVPDAAVREGDSGHPANPRRLQLLLEKLRRLKPPPDGDKDRGALG